MKKPPITAIQRGIGTGMGKTNTHRFANKNEPNATKKLGGVSGFWKEIERRSNDQRETRKLLQGICDRPEWDGSSDPTKFSVSWKGYIFTPVGGDYSFGGWIDGKVSIEINGEVVTNRDTTGSSYSKTITLPGGSCVPVSMSFATNGGSNNMALNWRPPGAAAGEAVPRVYLRHSLNP